MLVGQCLGVALLFEESRDCSQATGGCLVMDAKLQVSTSLAELLPPPLLLCLVRKGVPDSRYGTHP